MMKKFTLYSALFLFCILGTLSPGFAQSISGVVLDAQSEEALPFTNVAVIGSFNGTVSNDEGNFVLDLAKLSPGDSVVFSHVGYVVKKIVREDLRDGQSIRLQPAAVKLRMVDVSPREMTAKEIVELVEDNYKKNHPRRTTKQRIFYHKYEKTPFSDQNRLDVTESNFVGLSKETFDELFKKIPEEFIEYQDAIVDLYHHEDSHHLVPVEAISLEEGSQQDLYEEFEKELNVLFEDVQASRRNEDIYYKLKSGIFSYKFKEQSVNDSIYQEAVRDSTHVPVATHELKTTLTTVLENYSEMKSDNWEFITKRGRYEYHLEKVTLYNDDLVYEIRFKPLKKGVYEGVMYISTSNYAVLQLDFAFADGKKDDAIQVLGVGYAMNYKEARVIFEKGTDGYYLKYIKAHQNESSSINRGLSIMKMKERFLWDKELNAIDMELEVYFDLDSHWEILVVDRESIAESQFNQVKQPLLTKFKMEYANSPEMWENGTLLVPNAELKAYKRKE